MSKLQTRNAFSNTSLQDTDLFWIEVDLGGGTFESQKITGLQLKTILSQDPLVNDVVYIDQNTPTTGGVVFSPNTPLTQDVLYVSTSNGSTWIYDGSAYVTYTLPTTTTSNFNLAGTTIDAGANKSSAIKRSGDIISGEDNLNAKISNTTGVSHTSEGYSQIIETTYSNTYYPILRQTRKRGTLSSNSGANNGDILGTHAFNSNGDSASISVKATETQTSSNRGSEIILSNCANGSNTQVENLKIQQDGKVKISNAYTLPSTAPTSGQVLGYSSAGVSSWNTLDKNSVGLGNVANVDTTNASNITSGTLGTARMGSGTANSTTYLRGDNTWATISAGGLTKFTESRTTTSPNNIVNVDSLASGTGLSTVDVDVSIVPKGTGAFLLAIPDNTTTGGNKRGAGAVDLQMLRTLNTAVASGSYSTAFGLNNQASGYGSIAGGNANIASGSYSTALGNTNTATYDYAVALGRFCNATSTSFAIGVSCNASGAGSVALGGTNTSSGASSTTLGSNCTAGGQYSISGGYNNSASAYQTTAIGASCTASNTNSTAIGYRCKATGDTSLVLGGYYYSDSTASGQNSVVLGFGTASSNFATALGSSNTASGTYSTAIGYGSNTFGVSGRIAMSGNIFTSGGDAQKSIVRMGRRTTDATLTTLTTDNGALISVDTQLTLQNQQLIRFKGTLTGKQSGSTNVGVWDIDGVIVRGANAGTTTLVGTPTITAVTNLNSWGTPTITADTTNGCLKIEVQGLAGTNIQWLAILDTIDNLYL